MPKKYESMRDSFKQSGMKEGAAKTKAAKIHNAGRSANTKPVTRKSHGRKK